MAIAPILKRAVRTKRGRSEAVRQILPSREVLGGPGRSREVLVNLSSCLSRKLSTPTLPMTRMELIPEARPAEEGSFEKRKRTRTRVSCRAASVLFKIKLK